MSNNRLIRNLMADFEDVDNGDDDTRTTTKRGGSGSQTQGSSLPSETLGNIPLILSAIVANEGEKGSELLTPQKRLLNSIEIVEKVVMEELDRLKRTPSAIKAERDQKLRTLMSMRIWDSATHWMMAGSMKIDNVAADWKMDADIEF